MKKFSILFSFILFFALTFTTNVFAYNDSSDAYYYFENDTYPSAYYENTGNYSYYPFVYSADNKTFMLLFRASKSFNITDNLTITVLDNGTLQLLCPVNGLQAYYFQLQDNGTRWQNYGINGIQGVGGNPKTYSYSEFTEVLISDFNVYKEDGSLFFPIPPTPTLTVEMMVAQEVPVMAEKITQAMMIILLCGVGCLAFLMALPTLSKVFSIFRLK